jgi:hypothetical protein
MRWFNIIPLVAVVGIGFWLAIGYGAAPTAAEAVRWLVLTATILALLLMALPVYLYTQTGMQRKRVQIKGYLPYPVEAGSAPLI